MSNVGDLVARVTLEGMDGVQRQLNNLSDSMQSVSNRVSSVGDSFKNAGDSISNLGQDLAPISAGLGAIGLAGITASNELESAMNVFKTKLGYTGKELEEMQKSMEKVGSTGVGSFNEVADALVTVTQNMGDLKGEELETVTEQAVQLAKVMEVEVSEVTRSAGTLMKQFGVDSGQAMDLIAKGYQSNLDFSGEFLDSLNEYSVHFKSLGFSAEDMFNIMITGAEEGAWNLDKVGDAIKEGNIRLKDLSDGSAEAFEALGLDAQTMFNDFASGGDKAKLAFMTVTGALSKVESETERNALGVALFGTQYEDLEKDVVASFAKIEDKLGDYGGTASKVAEDNKTFSQIMLGAWNDIQVAIQPVGDALKGMITTVLPPLLSMVKVVASGFASLPTPVQYFIVALGGIVAVIPILLIGIGSLVSAFGGIVNGIGVLVKGFSLIPSAGAGILTAFKAIGTGLRALSMAFMANPFMLIVVGIVAVVALVIAYWDEIVEVTKAVFSALSDWFEPYWDAFKDMVAGVVDFLKGLWDMYVAYWTTIFEALKKVVEVAWEAIKAIFKVALTILLVLIAPLYNAFVEIWNKIVEYISKAWDKIKETFLVLVEYLKSMLEAVKTAFSTAWNYIYKNIISPVIEAIKKVIQALVDKVTQVLTAIKTAFSTAWNYINNTIISPVINAIKNTINSLISKVTGVVNSVKSVFSSGFNAVKGFVSSAVDAVVSKITGIWTKAKEIADKIKNAFSNIFKSIKIPTFSLGGWTVKDLPKLPKMSIQWNAKGGILDDTTLIGAGEKGAEAIVPLSSQRRMAPFAKAVAQFMPDYAGAGAGGLNITVSQMVVREEADIRRVSQELYKLIERDRKGGGKR